MSKTSKNEDLFEAELFSEEVKYLMKIIPTGYALINPAKSSRLKHSKKPTTSRKKKATPPPSADPYYNVSAVKRMSRQKRLRTYGHEFGQATKGGGSKALSEPLKKCYKLLQKMMRQKGGEHFLKPVNPEELNIPDYFTIIKEPMDMGTVEKKLKDGEYETINDYAKDMRLIWNNALSYNPKNSFIYNITMSLKEIFEKGFKEIESSGFENFNYVNTEIRSKPKAAKASVTVQEKPMTYYEKKALSESIKGLNPDHLHGVWDIVCNVDSNLSKQNELVFDIDKLPNSTARELEKYVKSKLQSSNKPIKKKSKKGLYVHSQEAEPVQKPALQPTTTVGNVGQPSFPVVGQEDGQNRERSKSRSSDSSFFTDSDENE